MKNPCIFIVILSLLSLSASAQNVKLPFFWDELTSPDFRKAVGQADSVCIIPIGVIEKHGAQLPLGTDVIRAHEMCKRAAEKEYCIVFPDFYVGEISIAQHQPGTVSYSHTLMLQMLDETCREIARNGLKKIILVNTHGGNNSFLPYFLQIQMESPKDYSVFLFELRETAETQQQIKSLRTSTTGGHADEIETGEMLVICPDLVKMERTTSESGRDFARLPLTNVTTGITWYARYPNHYAGKSEGATAKLGEVRLSSRSQQLADAIKALKVDQTTKRLQDEFFQQRQAPLKTKIFE
jgi:creatinine amidohydrolase